MENAMEIAKLIFEIKQDWANLISNPVVIKTAVKIILAVIFVVAKSLLGDTHKDDDDD